MVSSPAAILNRAVIEKARRAATPKLPRKLCSRHPEGSHPLRLGLPRGKDFPGFRWFISMVLLPQRRVAQRQDPHRRKCLDIPFSDLFLAGQQLQTDGKGGCWSTRPVYLKSSQISGARFPPPTPLPRRPQPPTLRRRTGGRRERSFVC